MDQTDSDADERAEKSTSLNDVYVYVSHKNGRFAGAMAGCSTMPLFLERGGRCHKCQRKLNTGDDWIVEHTLALENGGTNDWDNLGITCSWCKPRKDAEDHAQAGKQRRAATKHLVPKSMRKSSWKSKWKRKLNGQTVERG